MFFHNFINHETMLHIRYSSQTYFNTLRPRQNGCNFPDDIFKCMFLKENVSTTIKISLDIVPRGPITNTPTFSSVSWLLQNFPQSVTVLLPWSVQNIITIGRVQNKLHERSSDEFCRFILCCNVTINLMPTLFFVFCCCCCFLGDRILPKSI